MSGRSGDHKRALGVGRGRSTRVDDTGPVQRHQVEGLDGELLDGVERVTDYGFASRPNEGAEGILLAVAGLRGQAVMIAVGDRRYRLLLGPGEVALHDDKGQLVYLSADGIRLVSPIKVSIEAPEVAVTAETIVLDGKVSLGGADGLKAVALHDDAVVAGKVVASAERASAK